VIAAAVVPLTEQAHDIDRIWNLFVVIALLVGGFVAALIGYVVVRFRRRDDRLPRQVRENIPMELVYTAIPFVIVVGLFAVTFVSVRALDKVDDDPDVVVEVTGFQWGWRFHYPESGVTVATGDGTIPTLVLPAGEKVRFDITSTDVIHSFWIPGFRFKRDAFPDQHTAFQVDVGDRTGEYQNVGVCAEFCGLQHQAMRFSVAIVPPEQFDAWTGG
jgi:cytochrome c oxidase subunit 2